MQLYPLSFSLSSFISFMASPRPAFTPSLLSYLFLFTLIFSCSSASASIAKVSPSDSQKVSVGLYYESLCPYSANFIVNYLVKIFEDDFISIVDLNLVPWGNARIKANNSVNCQVFLPIF